jgi:hypothetical protein
MSARPAAVTNPTYPLPKTEMRIMATPPQGIFSVSASAARKLRSPLDAM